MSGKSGSIVLFLRHLPCDVSRRELKEFVHVHLRRAGVRGTLLLQLCSHCSILRVTDLSRGSEEYHGLVEIQPAGLALQAIDILNGKQFAGSRSRCADTGTGRPGGSTVRVGPGRNPAPRTCRR